MRYLNRQLGRIVRTLGFDREWARGEGAHLIDTDGRATWTSLRLRRIRGRAQPPRRDGGAAGAVGRAHRQPAAARDLAAAAARWPRRWSRALPSRSRRCCRRTPAPRPSRRAIKLRGPPRAGRGSCTPTRAFHGLTFGSLSVNGDDDFREGFGPLLPGLRPRAVRRSRRAAPQLARGDVAAFIVEPIQGKGVYVAPDGYLAGAQAACREHGALLVCDEVQTGLGRTGQFFALEHWGVVPDMVTVAKALSGGFVPVGACSPAAPCSTASSTRWSAASSTARRSATATSPPRRRSPRCA